MASSHKIFTCLTLGASLLSVSACGLAYTGSMPTGYTYHHDTYKSAAPEQSSEITIEQRKYMDAAQAEQFRDAVYDLLEKVTMRAGMPPKPVYILAPDPMTTFYANIDNDLRESMRHIGYAISDTSSGAYVFTYEALPIMHGQDQVDRATNNVQLTLRVFSGLGENDRQLTEETGQYFIQGAHELDVAPSNYDALPVSYQVVEPQYKEATRPRSIAAPTMAVPSPQVEIAPVLSQPVVRAPSVSVPQSSAVAPSIVVPAVKAPSRDDIIIINRGDRASISMEVPEEDGNALQRAIPSARQAVRGRVSNPADY